MHDLSCFTDNIVEEDNSALPCTHSLDQTVIDMNDRFGPWELEEFKNFEELGHMLILLRGNNIDHLVGFVGVVPLLDTTDVTGKID